MLIEEFRALACKMGAMGDLWLWVLWSTPESHPPSGWFVVPKTLMLGSLDP